MSKELTMNLPTSWGVALGRGLDAESWARVLRMYQRRNSMGTERTRLRDLRRWYRLARAFTHESRAMCAVMAFEFWRTNHVPPADSELLADGWPAEVVAAV